MEYTSKYYKASFLQLALVSISVIIISVILSNNLSGNLLGFVIYFTIYGLFYLILFFILIGILSLINQNVKSKYSKGFILGSVVHGFMLLFPFSLLLLISDVLLKWSAFQTIVATSIITSVSYSVTDLIRLGGNKSLNLIISFVVGFVFMVLFLLFISVKII